MRGAVGSETVLWRGWGVPQEEGFKALLSEAVQVPGARLRPAPREPVFGSNEPAISFTRLEPLVALTAVEPRLPSGVLSQSSSGSIFGTISHHRRADKRHVVELTLVGEDVAVGVRGHGEVALPDVLRYCEETVGMLREGLDQVDDGELGL